MQFVRTSSVGCFTTPGEIPLGTLLAARAASQPLFAPTVASRTRLPSRTTAIQIFGNKTPLDGIVRPRCGEILQCRDPRPSQGSKRHGAATGQLWALSRTKDVAMTQEIDIVARRGIARKRTHDTYAEHTRNAVASSPVLAQHGTGTRDECHAETPCSNIGVT